MYDNLLNVHDLVITSKGRFGRIIKVITNNKTKVQYEVMIGNRIVIIDSEQCRLAKSTTPLKVYFKYHHNGQDYEDKDIVHITKDVELYNANHSSSIVDIVSYYLFNKLGIKVEITSIKTI